MHFMNPVFFRFRRRFLLRTFQLTEITFRFWRSVIVQKLLSVMVRGRRSRRTCRQTLFVLRLDVLTFVMKLLTQLFLLLTRLVFPDFRQSGWDRIPRRSVLFRLFWLTQTGIRGKKPRRIRPLTFPNLFRWVVPLRFRVGVKLRLTRRTFLKLRIVTMELFLSGMKTWFPWFLILVTSLLLLQLRVTWVWVPLRLSHSVRPSVLIRQKGLRVVVPRALEPGHCRRRSRLNRTGVVPVRRVFRGRVVVP